MAKPRKVTADTFYDVFSSWPADDRAIALKVLEQTHRQLVKMEKPYAVTVTTGPHHEVRRLNDQAAEQQSAEQQSQGSLLPGDPHERTAVIEGWKGKAGLAAVPSSPSHLTTCPECGQGQETGHSVDCVFMGLR